MSHPNFKRPDAIALDAPRLPPRIASLIDTHDPAFESILEVVWDMLGADIEFTPAVIALAVKLGRARHARLEVHRQEIEKSAIYTAVSERPVAEARVACLIGKHDPVVYYLENGSRVKIGWTGNLRTRLSALSLRPENVLLLIPGGKVQEATEHDRFRAYRIGNTEWFELSQEIQAFITRQVISTG